MRKIKKFKIPIYSYDIYRKAKKLKLNIENSHLKDSNAVKEFISTIASEMQPSVVFDFFKNDSPLWPKIKTIENQFAATCGIITLGELDKKINSLTDILEKELSKISALVFLNTGINIIKDLVQEEAKKESFEISQLFYLFFPENINYEKEISKIQEKEILSELALKLESEKIGVKIENNNIFPEYTAFFSIPWLAKKKRK